MAKAKNGLPRKKHRILKTLGIILAVIIVIVSCVYFFVLQHSDIGTNPQIDKWYRVSIDVMESSEGK